MAELFPQLKFELKYEEPGMAFQGKLVLQQGEITEDTEQEMTGLGYTA